MIKIDWSKWIKETYPDNKFLQMGLEKEFKEDTEIQKLLSKPNTERKIKARVKRLANIEEGKWMYQLSLNLKQKEESSK